MFEFRLRLWIERKSTGTTSQPLATTSYLFKSESPKTTSPGRPTLIPDVGHKHRSSHIHSLSLHSVGTSKTSLIHHIQTCLILDASLRDTHHPCSPQVRTDGRNQRMAFRGLVFLEGWSLWDVILLLAPARSVRRFILLSPCLHPLTPQYCNLEQRSRMKSTLLSRKHKEHN